MLLADVVACQVHSAMLGYPGSLFEQHWNVFRLSGGLVLVAHQERRDVKHAPFDQILQLEVRLDILDNEFAAARQRALVLRLQLLLVSLVRLEGAGLYASGLLEPAFALTMVMHQFFCL